MTLLRYFFSAHRDYLISCAVACVGAAILATLWRGLPLPVLKLFPPVPVVIGAAISGLPLLFVLRNSGIAAKPASASLRGTLLLLSLGAILAIPPIAIDLTIGFSPGMNLPLPPAAFFYPAIALVAEIVFHLMPLAMLAHFLPKSMSRAWVITPVIFVEPVFQVLFGGGPALQSWLVFSNVSLISAVQLWLFQRYGFGAMFGLRITFYLFWHILWGAARLQIVYA